MYSGKSCAIKSLKSNKDYSPFALFTWEYNYMWKVSGYEPWQLACGSYDTWISSHIRMLEKHRPDILFYSGAGSGDKEPVLISEDFEKWHISNSNDKKEYILLKDSLTLYEKETNHKGCDSVGRIDSFKDADTLINQSSFSDIYLKGLSELIKKVGDRALILPHHSPAYIRGCYAFGFEKAMETMLLDPKLFMHVCDIYREEEYVRMKNLKDAGAEAVFIADGWASCDIISREMFIKFALPYQISIIDAAHKAGLYIVLWNEGNIIPILDLEASLEMDAFSFEQPRKGISVTVERVRKAFGKDRCLFGNLDSELLLMDNDINKINESVMIQHEQSGKCNPFIMCTGSPIPDNVEISAVDKIINSHRNLAKY